MTIPSYDDLTPGIPDVLDSESVSQLTQFLRHDVKVSNTRTGDQADLSKKNSPVLLGSCAKTSLFACLLRTADCELQTLLAIARDFSPRVMRVSAHEILLDVSGLGRLIGEPPAIAAALARAIAEAGLAATARVAIAPTQIAARLLAMQLPDDPMTRLPDIPVTFLQSLETLPAAMNPRVYETLARWGIATLGDLVALPAADLASRLGRRGVALQRLARGLDPRPFVPDADTPRYIGRLELEWPLDTLEPLSFVFARLLEPLSAALERADRAAAAIRLELRLTTRAAHTRVLQLPAPMRDARVLRTLLLLDLESHPLFRGASEVMIDIISIELDPAPGRITQFSLLERAVPSPETLSTLTARLAALVGESRIGSAVLLDTHQPGAFAMTRFAPESRGPASAREVICAGYGEASPKPLRGEGGANGGNGAVLRRQRVPPAIRVRVEHGRPVYLAATKRSMPQGAVTQAAGPWRTSGGWWSRSGAGGWGLGHGAEAGTGGSGPRHGAEAGWDRDEWDVALASGAVCRIYQDRTTDRWFLDGIYD